MSASRWVKFPSQYEKAKWLDAAASNDAASPSLQRLAQVFSGGATLARRGERGTLLYGVQVIPGSIVLTAGVLPVLEHLHAMIRDGIEYSRDRVNGVRWEEFADTLSILRRRYDDCDGKSRAVVALVRALVIDPPGWMSGRLHAELRETRARIRPIFNGRNFVHVQPELKWPGSDQVEGNAEGWVVAEVIVEGAGIGDDVEQFKRGGTYPMAGPKGWAAPAL